MTHAIDELPQTAFANEQTEQSASSTFIDNQLTENQNQNNEHWSLEDSGHLESGKNEEKVVTLVKKVNVKMGLMQMQQKKSMN